MNRSTVKPIDPNVITLRGLFYEWIKNRRLILSLMIVAMMGGALYSFLQTPKYYADVLIRVKENQSSSMSNIALPYAVLAENKNAAMYSALLHSRYILSPTIDALGLNVIAKPYQWPLFDTLFPSHNKIQVEKFIVPLNAENKRFFLIMDAPQHFRLYDKKRMLLEGTVGQLVRNPEGTIALKVQSLEGKLGSRFVITKQTDDKIISRLLPHLTIKDLGAVTGKNEKTGILQISYVDENPDRAVNILNTSVNILRQKNIEQNSAKAKETLNFLQQQLPLTKKSLETAETVFNTYRAASKKLDIKTETQFFLNQLADVDRQLTRLRLDRRALLQENTEEHPFINELDEKTQSLLIERKELEDKIKQLPASDQIAVSMMRDIRVNHELYVSLLKKIQELKVEAASTVSELQIISLAKMPYAPLSAHRGLILLASNLCGFLLGCIIVFARKILFASPINDPYWIEQHFGLANVATIPYSQRQEMLRTKKILAREYPEDIALEALRSLRTHLQIVLCGATNNIIGMMGLGPQIGKSFISVNLAYLLAEAGKRVLLIDGNLRQAHLHDYFHNKRTPGLSEVINNTHTLEHALQTTSHSNLTLLSAGAYPTHPSELLMKDRCNEIIKTLSSQYDIVMIDTSPILEVTDATIISRFAATNFLVLGIDSHQPIEIEMALKQLSHAHVKLQGFICNHLKKELRISEMLRYSHSYHYASNL